MKVLLLNGSPRGEKNGIFADARFMRIYRLRAGGDGL